VHIEDGIPVAGAHRTGGSIRVHEQIDLVRNGMGRRNQIPAQLFRAGKDRVLHAAEAGTNHFRRGKFHRGFQRIGFQ